MQISFLNPGFFVLLALIPALWFFPRKLDDKFHGILRSVLMALIVTALAQPILLTPGSENHRVVIVDRSASLDNTQRAEAERVLAKLTGNAGVRDKLTIVELGSPLQADAESATAQSLRVNREGSESSLSLALAIAAQQFPAGAGGRITLISDGLSTDRDWGGIVARLIERGLTVDVHDLGTRDDDVYPSALYTNAELRMGDTVEVFATVIGTGPVTVVLTDGAGKELARTRAHIEGRGDVALSFEPETSGFTTLTAEVVAEGRDSNTRNNRVSAGFAVQRPIRVFYLADRVRDSAAYLQHLLGAGFVVESPDVSLDTGAPLESYELVVVDDVPAEFLPRAFQQKLTSAIRERGLGLLYAGGRRAFGEGGYHETPLASVLPVEFQQRTEKKEPTVALAIIIDTSGSMGGKPIELAKQVARLSLTKLKNTDIVGVVEFYGAKNWAVPLQTMRNRSLVERAIGRMHAGGGTTLLPAIEEAFYGLKNVRANYKHILLISDAGVEDADFETVIGDLTREGIVLSTVLPARGEDNAVMSLMAEFGGGRFYPVPGPFNLVEINFRKPEETRLPAYKAGHYPIAARTGSGWWGEVDRLDLPAVSGYVEVQNRRDADVLLETEGSGHPLLSSWRFGLGRVTALMTEPVGPGTRNWQAWADYGRLLARVMRRTAADGQAFDYQLLRLGDELYVDAVRIVPEQVGPALQVVDGQHDGTHLSFDEMAPGWFRASLSVPATENVQLLNSASDYQLIANSALSAETQVDPQRGLDLARLAGATNGVVLNGGETGTDMLASSTALSLRKLSPWLFLLALLVYLGELLYRRWPTGA